MHYVNCGRAKRPGFGVESRVRRSARTTAWWREQDDSTHGFGEAEAVYAAFEALVAAC